MPPRSTTTATPTKGRRATSAKTTRRTRTPARRSRLAPAKTARGLLPADAPLALDGPDVAPLVDDVRRAGGTPLGAFRDPLAGRPLLLAALPLGALSPTPFQRDLSPAHVKRLAARIDDSGAFLDPLIVVRGPDGTLWTPNGRHRLAAAKVLGLRQVTALVATDEALAFRILALNTEKAHNLRDRSLEVIRMARELARREPSTTEAEQQAAFEEPALLTLGICYEHDGRFAGSAYAPFLRKVDRFQPGPLPASLRRRDGWAARLLEVETEVGRRVQELRARGFQSPYLRMLVVARINPVRFHKVTRGDAGPAMPIAEALTRMLAAARRFDAAKIRQQDLALVAAVAPPVDER